MQIEIKFKENVPLMMAMDLIKEMAELAKLFDAVHKVNVRFEDGEEQRMINVENNRVPRISK